MRRTPPAGRCRRRAPPSSRPAQHHAWRRFAASPALAQRLPWASLPWLGQPEERGRAWRPDWADPRAHPSSVGCPRSKG
jgi:hypothetical protein